MKDSHQAPTHLGSWGVIIQLKKIVLEYDSYHLGLVPRGVLSFFLHKYAWAYHLPFTPQNYQEFQVPQIIFEILATPKNIPHSVPWP